MPILVKFLLENHQGIVDQAIWAVGNLAGDSSKLRDYLLDLGALNALIYVINSGPNPNNMAQGAWALSNLCRGNPSPDYQKVK